MKNFSDPHISDAAEKSLGRASTLPFRARVGQRLNRVEAC